MSAPTWTSRRRLPDDWHWWFSADGDVVTPRRLRNREPRRRFILLFPPNTSRELAEETMRHFEAQVRKRGQIVIGTAGVTVKEIA